MNDFEKMLSFSGQKKTNPEAKNEENIRAKQIVAKNNSIEFEKPFQRFEKVKRFNKVTVEIGPFAVNINIQFLRPFLDWAQRNLQEEQYLQQKKVESYFNKNNPAIEIHSFYRNPDGSGSLEIGKELTKAKNNNIVILLNGLVNVRDVAEANPRFVRFALMMARIHPVNIVRHGLNAKKIIKGDSIPQYIINTTETIQKKLFDKKPCQVFIVRNAAAKDLSEVIQNGAGQTVLVVGGHGDFGSLEMTDKRVISEEIASPELKLKAFVQHTCGVKGDNAQVEMGKRFAEQTFGWTRIVYPLDLIEQPLPKRSSNSATN